MPEVSPPRSDPARRLALATMLISSALLVVLGMAYAVSDSRLAFAQAADSFSDVLTALALFVSIGVASAPPDEGHPVGHRRAEPIAALVAAVMAGVLAVEVLRSAVTAISFGHEPELSWPLALAFAVKAVAKSVVALFARRRSAERPSPALDALFVDARNDVLVCVLALVGFVAALYGSAGWDAWLAIPVGLWIGWAGVSLGRDNVHLLMGASPPRERREALLLAVVAVPGVRSAHRLVARHDGPALDVSVDVVVDPTLTLRAAHDIGHAVERRLLQEPDVVHVLVHVDLEVDEGGSTDRG